MANVMFDWPEMVALLFLIIGFITAIFSGNLWVLYTVCFLMGLLFGKVWHRFKTTTCIPLLMAVIAFFLGFLLGGFYANFRLIALLLLTGMLAGYWLHEKKIIRDFGF